MFKQRLQQDQIQALKNQEKDKLNILRYLLAQIKNKEIEKQKELENEEIISLVRKQVKELQEAVSHAQNAGRQDLVEENQKQLNIVSSYLPQELTDADLKGEIEKILAENKDLYQKNPKALIGICIQKLKSKADPGRIVKILQSAH